MDSIVEDRLVHLAAVGLKELMSKRREVKSGTCDIEIVVRFKMGLESIEAVKETDLYKKYGSEYCEYLELLEKMDTSN